MAIATIVFSRAQTTVFETCVLSGKDTSPSAQVFPQVLYRRGPLEILVSPWFPTENPCAVYCCVRKQLSSLSWSFGMINLQFETQKREH